jgi:hypothetical protein
MRHFLLTVVVLSLISVPCAGAEFATVINSPPDAAPASIGPNTQLNLHDGGILPAHFDAGIPNGDSTDVEVNVFGGEIGDYFSAHSGATVNIRGGTVGYLFRAYGNSIVNIEGGSFGDRFSVYGGTTVIRGGEFRRDGYPLDGDVIPFPEFADGRVFSGVLADGTPFAFFIESFQDVFNPHTVQLVRTPLPDIGQVMLATPGDAVGMGVRRGQALIVRDGGALPDSFNAGEGSTVIIEGGVVGEDFEASGATVTINGGQIGNRFGAFAQAVVTMNDGIINGVVDVTRFSRFTLNGGRITHPFIARDGSLVEINGGTIGDTSGTSSFHAMPGSTVTVNGGRLGAISSALASRFTVNGGEVGDHFIATQDSIVTINDGMFGRYMELQLVKATINGGKFMDVEIRDGGVVDLRGGTFAETPTVNSFSKLTVWGREFALNGVPLANLTPNSPLVISQRGVTLNGVLADGSAFSFDTFAIRPDATLTVVLVPEGSSTRMAILSTGLLLALSRRRS